MAVLGALCACLVVLPAHAKADTIFSNLGPFVSSSDPGYDPPQIACTAKPKHSCATEFTSPGDFRLTQLVEPELSHGVGPGTFPISALTLYTNLNGKPGEALDQFRVLFRGTLGAYAPDAPFALNSSLQPLLFAGESYWLVLSNSNTVPFGSLAYWAANSTGDIGPIIGLAGNNSTPTTFGTQPAFKFDGSPVPEPSSLLLMGTSMAGLITFFRFRRKPNDHTGEA